MVDGQVPQTTCLWVLYAGAVGPRKCSLLDDAGLPRSSPDARLLPNLQGSWLSAQTGTSLEGTAVHCGGPVVDAYHWFGCPLGLLIDPATRRRLETNPNFGDPVGEIQIEVIRPLASFGEVFASPSSLASVQAKCGAAPLSVERNRGL